MKLLLSFSLMLFLLFSCKSSAQQHSKKEDKKQAEGSYYEDLSTVRPKYKVIEDTTEQVTSVDTAEVARPNMEVTHQVDSVIHRIAGHNKAHPPKINGYRVQIYNGGSQKLATDALLKAREVLGENIYGEAEWTSPVFRTRIGCFTDRLNAYKVYLKLQEDFPNALVVPDNNLSADCIH